MSRYLRAICYYLSYYIGINSMMCKRNETAIKGKNYHKIEKPKEYGNNKIFCNDFYSSCFCDRIQFY